MKLYRRFLATYLCVCLIPLVFSIAQLVNMRLEIQRSIEKDQEVTLQTATSDLESCLVEAANTLDVLEENDLVDSLAPQATVSPRSLYEMCSFIPALEAAAQQRDSYVSCFAYFPTSGYLVSNKSTYHPQLAGTSTWDLDIDYEDLLAALENGGVNAQVQPLYSQEGGGYLLVSKACYDNRYRTVHASLGILIRLDREPSFLQEDTARMFALTGEGTLFCGAQEGQAVAERMAATGKSQGKLTLQGQRWLYTVYPSETLSSLRYGLLVQEGAYFRSLAPLLWQLAALVLVILAGVALAVALSRRTWSPFKKVLPLVSAGENAGEYRSLAEFSRALTDFAQEKQRLMEQVVASEGRADVQALWQYLLGFSKDPACLSRYIEENQPYRVLAFSGAQGEKPLPGRRLAQALEGVFLDGLCLPLGDMAVVLCQEPGELDSLEEKLEQAQQAAGAPLACFASDVCLALSDAPEAWNWLQRAASWERFWQEPARPGLHSVRELRAYPGYFGEFPQHRKQLFAALAAGRRDKAHKLLETILQEDLLDSRLPVELIRNRCLNVLEALVPYLPEEDQAQAAQVMAAPTAREMTGRLRTLFARAQLPGQDAPQDNGLVAQVQAVIRENYQDPFLNVSLIADRLGRNLSTLSHQYKDLTGHGLLEDLHAVRLQAAKSLLKEGKTVRETAQLVGYGDSRALIRAFKRYEGSTPGQFAEKN